MSLRGMPALAVQVSLALLAHALPKPNPTSTWHVVWVGGQSNSIGTNTQEAGDYPTWPTIERIRMYCYSGRGCEKGSFDPAQVPIHGESNVGFSQTFANLLLKELPEDHGIVLLNTGAGGTGFVDGQWVVPDGSLTKNSIAAVESLAGDFAKSLCGTYELHAMLWHQGEDDAGDNRKGFHADYCTYLVDDMSKLVDHFRANFHGASAGTPFIDGGLLPYWVDTSSSYENSEVMDAIYALNTSRPCTGTADSRIFADYISGTQTPNGDPEARSGIDGSVIHFNATQAVMMGYQYFDAYKRAVLLNGVVPSDKTKGCSDTSPPAVVQCTPSSFALV